MKSIKLIHHDSLVSSNKWLAENYKKFKLPVGVKTDFQSVGKGQGSNSWESEKGKNLLLSIMIPLEKLFAEQNFFISKISALSVLDVLNESIEKAVIKWPNDILFEKKKIAGILIENTLMNDKLIRSIIGIGINLNQTEFSEMELEPTSIRLITGNEIDREVFLESFLGHFHEYLAMLKHHEFDLIDKLYFSQLLNFNHWREYISNGVSFSAAIRDVMDDGYLVLETKDGKFRKFGFGEISYVLD